MSSESSFESKTYLIICCSFLDLILRLLHIFQLNEEIEKNLFILSLTKYLIIKKGTLITDSHVLTAAHCVLLYVRLLSHLKMNMSQIFSLIEVHVGINQHVSSTSNITEDDSPSTTSSSSHLGNDNVYGVEWFDWHTDFKFTPSVLYNDIAILKLNRPVNLNRPQVDRPHIYYIQYIIYSTPYLKFFL